MSEDEPVRVSVIRSSSFNVGWEYTHRRWLLLVLESDLTDGQKVDLVTRGLHCEFKTGTSSYVSQATIAKKNGHSERQVIRSDRAGEAAGLLQMTEERKGTSNIYRLTAPVTEWSPLTEESGVPLTEESSPPDRGVRGPLTEESPKEEVKKESKKISKSSSSARGAERLDDDASADLSGGELASSPSAQGAASPGPVSGQPDREDRGSKDEWARSVTEYLSERAQELSRPGVNPTTSLITVLNLLAEKHTRLIVEEAILWCAGGFAKNHPHLVFMENPGGYLTNLLPSIVQSYLVARNHQAERLGEDPQKFDLAQWCEDQQDAEETEALAEREAQQEAAHAAEREQQEQEALLLALGTELAELRGGSAESQNEILAKEARKLGMAETIKHAQFSIVAAREQNHRRDFPDHYPSCGDCRDCQHDRTCGRRVHRDDVECSYELAEGAAIEASVCGVSIKYGGISMALH